MEVPYLIQRASFCHRENSKGIDSIVRFDYMGSSEFEWGALPKSLKAIRANISDYVHSVVDIKGKPISVYCGSSQVSEIKEYLIGLSENKFRLKEFSGFNNYINDNEMKYSRFDLWWDIENHLIFWKSDVSDDRQVIEKLREIN